MFQQLSEAALAHGHCRCVPPAVMSIETLGQVHQLNDCAVDGFTNYEHAVNG